MTARASIPLTAESPAGRVDLLVDGSRPLTELIGPLAAATGAPAGLSWHLWEGQRRLDLDRSLSDHGVCAGSELRLLPAP